MPEGDPDDQSPVRLALYTGWVVDRGDPLKIGRVRVRVPGIVDLSGWAFPLSMARGRGLGFFDVPEVGSEVGVWWQAGDPDHPFYVPGNFIAPGGAGLGPTAIQAADVTPDTAPQIKVWETPDHVLLFDGRAGREAFEVRDKNTGDGVSYDGVTRALEVRGTVSVKIVSLGTVQIDALAVTILGRPVVPGAGPIR